MAPAPVDPQPGPAPDGDARRKRLRWWAALWPLVPVPQLLSQRLYLRIWLAVVLALAVLTLLAGWLWRLDRDRDRAERPGREIVIFNAAGEVVGQAPARPIRPPGHGGPVEFEVTTRDGDTLYVQLPRRPPGKAGPPDRGWSLQSWGFGGTLVFLAVAVALGTYPVVRWLTQRLERLREGVERWGKGDLSARLPVQGDDEVAYLAQRFNVAAERVQVLVQSHKALLANASHELRSPLARIRMGLELMAGGDADRQQRQRAEIARNIAELDLLIDEILLASRLDATEQSPLQWETIDLTGLAAEECARTGAQLQVEAQPMLQGDARLLRRLIRNLLENAERYGKTVPPAAAQSTAAEPNAAGARADADAEPGVVLTLAETDEAGARNAIITVDDRGPGVPLVYCDQIFEPFFRLPGASEKHGGVGLGLSLVRSIAVRHGGSVQCLPRPSGGARFVVRLPIQV
ncbi:MAG TPA: HAMP domain-containing sensor histidine kinase [Burkholderiaceae bacterium]|nr:HAMP domain-containing sensor histidine kinase [Burkholderiaceae bacterium]